MPKIEKLLDENLFQKRFLFQENLKLLSGKGMLEEAYKLIKKFGS